MENTKEIITPIDKVKVVLKEWITLAEWEEIQKPITDVKMVLEAGGIGKSEINVGEAQEKSKNKAIEIVVLSVNGETKDVVSRVKELKKKDGLFVLIEVDKVVSGEGFTQPEQK